ncbi:MAG TPA: hypothetical protein VGO93_15755 [Candidatus Xenobia bacterium]|jgi:DEAD/DEAH box helicase domain-containing protein
MSRLYGPPAVFDDRRPEERWKAALALAGLPATVGRIDGGVSQTTRVRLIKYCTVLVMTPDVAHAWLLSSVGDKTVQHFLSLLHGRLQVIAASATLRAAEDELTCEFWLPPKGVDFLLTTFIANLAPDTRFISFVDSRKLTDQITTILARRHDQAGDGPGDDDPEPVALADPLQKLDVLPYRASYETADREFIRSRLATGKPPSWSASLGPPPASTNASAGWGATPWPGPPHPHRDVYAEASSATRPPSFPSRWRRAPFRPTFKP